tara:strand:- start:366 stop:1085 length:720 start_codon:yes stop_codon:yes gene_type:complete
LKKVKPYNSTESKRSQIESMFDDISKKYDKLNQILTFGLHKRWRKRAINLIDNNPKKILDIATGTADFAIAAKELNPRNIIGIDISEKMIEIGNKKLKRQNLDHLIRLKIADSQNLPFEDNYFDAITIGFGVRNFEEIEKSISEAYRVLKKDGILIIMEPSTKNNKFLSVLSKFYFEVIVTNIGYLLSKNSSAYNYLSESVKAFIDGESFLKILDEAKFKNCKHFKFSFGIIDLYWAKK